MADILHRKFYAIIADPAAKNTFPASFEDAQVPVNPPGSGNTGIVGPGTLNRLAKFTSANTIGDSVFFEDDIHFGVTRSTGSFRFPDSGASRRGIEGRVSLDDFWYIGGGQMPGGITDRGFLEIATGDNGTEPIFVRQFLGVPTASNPTIVNEIILLDASGNSRFPGTMRIDTINNLGTAATNVLVPNATGILHKRTLFELSADMSAVTFSGTQTVAVDGTELNNLARTENYIVFTGTVATNITGLTGGVERGIIRVRCDVLNGITFTSQDTDSTAENRFDFNAVFRNGDQCLMVYHNSRWRLVENGIYSRRDIAETRNSTLSYVGSAAGSVMIRIFNGATQNGSWNAAGQITATLITQSRSTGATMSVRRDELPFNYTEVVGTDGILNDLAINDDTKLLDFTNADEITGIVPVTTNTGRLLRIFARGTTIIVRNESTGSSGANRFSIGSDLTINDGEVYSFIYTNSRWRLLTSSNSVNLVSSSVKFTSTNVYTTVFGNGANITSGALDTFDVSQIGLMDVIEIEITFNNETTNTDKIGILRFSLDGGTNRFLEIGKTGTDPYSGKFIIKIIYLGSDAYAVYGNIYINEGELQASNKSVFFSQTITNDWDFVAEFLSGVDGSSAYGGRTDFITEVYYRKATNGPFV